MRWFQCIASLLLAVILVACESSSGGSEGDSSLEGFWKGQQTLVEADCPSLSDMNELRGTQNFYLSIKEDKLDVTITPNNIIGRKSGAVPDSILGYSGSYVPSENEVTINLRNQRGETTLKHSDDFKEIGPEVLDYAPSGCLSGRYKVVLNKVEASADVVFARVRANSIQLGKRSSATGSVNAQGYTVYALKLAQGDYQKFKISTGGTAYNVVLYDSSGAQRGAASAGGCPLAKGYTEDDVCFEQRAVFERTYYLFLQLQERGASATAFTIETDFVPREE